MVCLVTETRLLCARPTKLTRTLTANYGNEEVSFVIQMEQFASICMDMTFIFRRESKAINIFPWWERERERETGGGMRGGGLFSLLKFENEWEKNKKERKKERKKEIQSQKCGIQTCSVNNKKKIMGGGERKMPGGDVPIDDLNC